MNIGIVTQARMTSTRLPGKVLMPLARRTVLAHHVTRLQWSGLPVVVATTTNASDDPLAYEAQRLGCQVFRGDEDDVLTRFYRTAVEHDLELVVRVTSDCPLVDGHLIAQAVGAWQRKGRTDVYLSNTIDRTYPRGFDLEVFSFDLLARASRNALSQHEREHVTPYMYGGTDPAISTQHLRRTSDGAEHLRLTLDTSDDYALLQVLFEKHSVADLEVERVIDLMRQHPELAELNQHVRQKRF